MRSPKQVLSEDRDSFSTSSVDATASDDTHPKHAAATKIGSHLIHGHEKVEWSEDDELLVSRSHKTSKGLSSRRRTKTPASVNLTGFSKSKTTSASRIRAESGTTGTGKFKNRQQRKKQRTNGEANSDEDLMEWTTPDYVQERRARFDERREHLQQGGLQLPPVYDQVFFSDDECLQQLTERPNLPLAKTSASYKDIELPYSLGIIPAAIAQYLREYQVKGAAFLHELFVYQKGGILGDDMGLGKTIQVIAFLTAAFGKTGDERDSKRMRKMRKAQKEYPKVLIICPGSLLANWQDEFHRWGWWHLDIYHGSAQQKSEVLLQAHSGRLEVMLTTYDTYRLSKSAINMVCWDCVIADECHKIKERTSEITKTMNEVNALCRIGLTGTAIQNKYEELWTLLNWTNPGRFGPISTWKTSICEPLKVGQSHNASNDQLAKARKTAKLLVQNLLPQFFLRRMKTLIKDQLPKKSDRVVFCPLTDTQTKAYERFIDSDIVQYIKNSTDLCSCGSGKKNGWCCNMLLDDGTKWQNWVFPAIATLQKLSNHLAILIPQGTDPSDKQAKDLELLQMAVPDDWRQLYKSRDSIMHTGNPEYCGKWRVLKKLLKFWHEEGSNKVLVFSHSVRLLRMLQNLFISTSYSVQYLDGSMNYEDRYAAVQDFNADPSQFVFLISTRAGGVGLNITSANKVVVVDPNWNPSYDLQAQDRAYRIGQTRDVEVFRLVSQGTLEEIVYARQIYKQQQASIGYSASSERRYFQGVQDRKDQKGEIFGLQNLFAYRGENIMLRDIVNKTNIAESKANVRVANIEFQDDNDLESLENEETAADQNNSVEKTFQSEPDSTDVMMSQLAAEITGDADKKSRLKAKKSPLRSDDGRPPRKHDPILAILASVGVSYTHENSEVIGSSKVEAQLSKRAEDANGSDLPQDQSKVFFDDSQSQPPRSSGTGTGTTTINELDGKARYCYRPPESVKRRQFCSMAEWAGYGGQVVDFALVVESWTQAERREFLDKFYAWRRRSILVDGLEKDGRKQVDGSNVGSGSKDGQQSERSSGRMGKGNDNEDEDEEEDDEL